MPRIKTNRASKVKVCVRCEVSFSRPNTYIDHLPLCQKVNKASSSSTCSRCSTPTSSKDAYIKHRKSCIRTCSYGCRQKPFKTAQICREHEHRMDCCAEARESDPRRVQVHVPSNRFSLTLADLNDVYDPALPKSAQENLQVTDSAIDAYLQSVADANPRFFAVTAAQSAVFAQFGDELDSDAGEKIEIPADTEVVGLPCCLRQGHWSLIIHDLVHGQIIVYDPLYKSSPRVISTATTLISAYGKAFGVPPVDINQLIYKKNCQHQRAGTQNCGLYVLHFAEMVAKRQPFNKDIEMVAFRQRVREVVLRQVGGREAHLSPYTPE